MSVAVGPGYSRSMDDREKELLATYRAEAAGLFQVNQAERGAAERVVALVFTVVAVTITAGIGAEAEQVVLPLPTLVLLLITYMFHQYTDLTVLGMARRELEVRVNDILGKPALLYETVIADIRKRPPLVTSVRMLQWLSGLLVVAIVVVGTVIAFDGEPWYVEWGYACATGGSLVTALVAYAGMLRSQDIASNEIRNALK